MRKKKQQPLIVVVNDDGVDSHGIKALTEVALQFGQVVVVAPSKGRSGMGHAITLANPLRMYKTYQKDKLSIYRTSGTTVDSVKLAVRNLLKDQEITLLLSGINQGANTSVSVIYSSTVAGAVEARINGIPSIAFSIVNYDKTCDFEAAKMAAFCILEKIFTDGIPPNMCLNVNIPNVKIDEIKGFKYTRQAINYWSEIFDERKDMVGRPYFWMGGDMVEKDKAKDTDMWAVKHNYISIQPLQIDHTNYELLEEMKKWKLKKQKK
ncbi:MAG: 5'/3'-nucleotidase SurE [Bacteroidales bacterium]|jgi:5'-nucleotidase|nr:5'/3'-nucleotidase SurE [Bacteroidales bacterium]